MRPGERPYWADASRWQASWGRWRESARRASVSVEAAVGCLLEYRMSCVELQRWVEHPQELLQQAADRELSQPRLAGDAEFRRWLDVLDHADSLSDELPEIALPQRLMRNPAVLRDWGSLVDPVMLDQALRCERAAALSTQTLEGWALRAGLSSMSCAPTG
jgi:hypothetical protein